MIIKGWLSVYWRLGVASFFALIGVVSGGANNRAFAQQEVSADPSLGTTVTVNGTTFQITGGTTVGDKNLFHSFSNFSVPIEGAADFRNAPTISNIFARVTGGSVSDIQGLICTHGTANLFLMNPNGIVFGPSAQLNIGGSFAATTANAIAFPNGGEFSLLSKVDSGNSLLSVNPSAFLFNQIASQPITNQSKSPFPGEPSFIDGLRAPDGKSLLLVGGNVRLDGGYVQAVDGRVELGGVAGAGTVGLNVDGNNLRLSFPNNVMRADVSLNNKAVVNASGESGGSIQVDGKRVTLANGSLIFADTLGSQNGQGIFIRASQLDISGSSSVSASTTSSGNAGTIQIQASDSVEVTGKDSFIGSVVTQSATGRTGDVSIDTTRLIARNGAQVFMNTSGKGQAGNLTVNASDSVKLLGTSADGRNSSGLFTRAELGSQGDAGNITINTRQLFVQDGAQVSTRSRGKGRAGNLTVNAPDSVELIGTLPGTEMRSRLIAVGFSSSRGAGDLTINTRRLIVRSGAIAVASTFGKGQAGNLTVNASDVDMSGVSADGRYRSSLLAETSGEGNATNLTINTRQLIVRDGALASASTVSVGQGGNLTVNASNLVELSGTSIIGQYRSALGAETTGQGNATNLTINTRQLIVRDGALVSAATFGEGQGGNLTVNASELVDLSGTTLNGQYSSGLFTQTQGSGNAGKLEVETGVLTVGDGAIVLASTFGQGNAGKISVQAHDSIYLSRGYIFSQVEGGATGNGGDINIQTRAIALTNGGEIAASVFRQQGNIPGGQGKGGSIQINATDSVNISGVDPNAFSSGLFTNTQRGASGQGGDITVKTGTFRITNGAVVTAQTLNPSNGGNITINGDTFEAISGGQVLTGTVGSGNAGKITINAKDRVTISGSDPTFSERFVRFGRDVVANSGSASGVFANTEVNSKGEGGTIFLTATNLNLINTGQISAQSLGTGKAGNININLRNTLQADMGQIFTNATSAGGGDISIKARDIRLRNDSDIRTNSGGGDGGNIFLTANNIIALEDSDILAFAPQGRGGEIKFTTAAFLSNPPYRPTRSTTNLATLDMLNNNGRADVNASGTVTGSISGIPDTTFLQNSLTELSQNPIDTNALIANSCITRGNKQEGTFIITGTGGLPNRPGDVSISTYPTGNVRGVQSEGASRWKQGDPIVEPLGVYKLDSGQLVLSRECAR
ncbi:filamentous hemagglutinin N-terminal domain-containing protein [Scytonema sp. NUACC26]|uniref:two-partner secretion domain-containing protein n=1 Tax=Scytonema sp. NUACC26 TaxID=3140176 RepID=UPI0034DBEF16